MANTPEFKIEPKLPVLAFNVDQLKAWATDLAERYAGIVVTEDAIADVKRDMAELNKARKAVDDARKEAVRRVSEPIRDFEAQIKEVCGIFETAYAALGAQVKSFEEAQREAKQKDVAGLIIEANMNAFGEPAFLDIPIQERWLNKTTSLKSIREDLVAIIERYMEAEQRKKALEQARQDRAAAIEQAVRAANAQHGVNLSIAGFMKTEFLNLETPLSQVLEAIDNTTSMIAATAAKPPQPAPVVTPAPPPQQPAKPSTEPEEDITLAVILTFGKSSEITVRAALEQLKKQCRSLSVRTR